MNSVPLSGHDGILIHMSLLGHSFYYFLILSHHTHVPAINYRLNDLHSKSVFICPKQHRDGRRELIYIYI